MPVTPTVLWEIDWPAVNAAQGVVDLSAPGATITIDGVTLRNLAAADGDPVNPEAPLAYETRAAGLFCSLAGPFATVPSFDALNPNAPSLIVTLDALGTALGFDPDPTRRYILQQYVVSFNVTGPANIVGAGTGFWRRPNDPVASQAAALVYYGAFNTTVDLPSYTWSNDGAQTDRVGRGPGGGGLFVTTLVSGPGMPNMQAYAVAPPGGTFAWPELWEHSLVGGGQGDGTAVSIGSREMLPFDAFSTWVVVNTSQMATNNTADMTVERWRMLVF